MKIKNGAALNICLSAGIIAICLILIVMLSGFRHEYKKFKQFLLTLIAILLIRYIFLEHIIFVIKALFLTLKGQEEEEEKEEGYTSISPVQDEGENVDDAQSLLEFLKLRLKSLKYQLNLSQSHRDENLNWKYKQLTAEFWLFGKYFVLLLLVVIYSRNSYAYYNTATMRRILNESYFSSYKREKLSTISDLYYWINDTLTEALNEGSDYDGSRIDEPGWVHFHQSKLLGVVRLQQVRHAKKRGNMHLDKQDYLPGWQKLNKSLPYVDKYWRIYYPWLSRPYEGVTSWLMSFANIGSLNTYSANSGYVVLLARHHKNSEKILNFLKENNWLDSKTAAVFIDFTLYNADSNIFTICSIIVEQTPFGNLLWQINVQSAELLWNMNEISTWWWLLIVLYTFQMLQFCKEMIVRAWLMAEFFKSRWNCVDLAIVLLNITLLSFTLLREYYVLHVLKAFVLAEKLEYVDFRVACIFNYMANVILGLLVCLASVRIWKILQFSSIFRTFNRTFYTSGVPLIFTILGIHIFICAIGKTAQILNGNHSEIFSGYLRSITSIMSFSFGFNSATSPDDLSHGGSILGFALYLILMLAVAIFLINMFITLILDHFSNARNERDQESPDKLTYWQFLMKEYPLGPFYEQFLRKIFAFYYKTKNQSVSENINDHLDEFEKQLQGQHIMGESGGQKNEESLTFDEKMKKQIDRTQNVAAILNLQMQVLDHLITLQSLETDSENEDSN